MKRHKPTSSRQKAASRTMALTYRGSSLGSKKYGLQMLPNCPQMLIMAVAAAFFSVVSPTVKAAQLYTAALAPKTPQMYRKEAQYRPARFRTVALMMNPTTATPIGAQMWYPLSFRLSLDQAMRYDTPAPMR